MASSYLAPKGTPVTLLEFEHGGATLIAESFGDGGPTFLLLHGIGMGRSVYLDVVQRLRGRVVALDLPGFGEAPEPSRTLTMERHADLVAAYLRHVGEEPVVVIGHSMGSQIAAELAARHPSLVKGVVLAGPTVNKAARNIAAQARYLLSDLVGERPLVIWRGAREYLRGGPHLIRKIRATVVHEPEDAYARIDRPVLVLRGEDDPLAPMSWCREIIDAIPGADLKVIPDHGHGTLISDSEPAAELIQGFADRL
ncbi:alpha/beta fold hydrolase [Microbacterium hydrocarbonoxydans]|uniref:alpha/beta fold hydrolase n=1 Tax=Microbacterium hydrocarbonoxydans TaxID=273678 RepID=UPI00203C03F2|nr:alpha/beta hydrolase [Microbacterium hydrocarbonoxydans]MCM3778540.1 alpha/beta hydrolase [Microbacterium hydrocarbonoxydans]